MFLALDFFGTTNWFIDLPEDFLSDADDEDLQLYKNGTVRSKVNVLSFLRVSKSYLNQVLQNSIHFCMIF